MTPEAVRTVAQIRKDFYSDFTVAMDTSVAVVNRNSYSSNFSIAFWPDHHQRLNYLCIFAYTAPDHLIPDRPLTLRLVINTGGDALVITRYKKGAQELNQDWHFQLILLPEEVLKLLPWLVNLIRFYDAGAANASSLKSPPELDFNPSITPFSGTVTTNQANLYLSQQSYHKQAILQPVLPKTYMGGELN